MYSSGKFENGVLAPHRKLPSARLGRKLTVASEPARNAHERRRSTLPAHPRLYEREAFLDEIAAMFSGNWERPNGPVIIEGASWTGRTALLGAAQRLAVESGLTVLNARGNDLERGTPWGLVRQLFYSQLPWLVAETDGSAEAHGAAALDELADPRFRHLEDSLFRLSSAASRARSGGRRSPRRS